MRDAHIISAIADNARTAVQRIMIILARQRVVFEQLHVIKIDGQEFSTINVVLRSDIETTRRLAKQVERIIEVNNVQIQTERQKEESYATHEIRKRRGESRHPERVSPI